MRLVDHDVRTPEWSESRLTILRRDGGLAASPLLPYILKAEGVVPFFFCAHLGEDVG
jgi:hypothetical protein